MYLLDLIHGSLLFEYTYTQWNRLFKSPIFIVLYWKHVIIINLSYEKVLKKRFIVPSVFSGIAQFLFII